jgi:hypothetical protein
MTAIILMLTLLNVPALAGTNIQGGNNWRVYKGAWFQIKYPAAFRVRPSQRSSSAQEYDSVFFHCARRQRGVLCVFTAVERSAD